MAWSDHWKYIRYGVATLVGMAATVGLYVTWQDVTEDEYVTTEEYAAVLLGTVERCLATSTAEPSIVTNIVTNTEPLYVENTNGLMWTPVGGTPTNYLIFTMATNVVTNISTNLSFVGGMPPPAILSVERVTVGRIISGYQTNYDDANGTWHTSPPEDPSTNPTWEVVSIYTNDSPAVYTNGFTNALTGYIPAGAIQELQAAVQGAIISYCNTSTAGWDNWTVTGLFAECGFTNGWDTNVGAAHAYIAKTNIAQIYSVLSRLRHISVSIPSTWHLSTFAKSVSAGGVSAWPHPITDQSFDDAKQKAEDNWVIKEAEAVEEPFFSGGFGISTSLREPFVSDYRADIAYTSLRPMVSFYPRYGWWHPIVQWATNTTMTFKYIAGTNAYGDVDFVFDAQGSGVLLGTNEVTLPITESYYSNAINKNVLVFGSIIPLPSSSFNLTWPENPSPQGRIFTRGFQINNLDESGLEYVDPMLVTIGFLYCTNAP